MGQQVDHGDLRGAARAKQMHLLSQPVDLQVGALAVQCDQQTVCCGLDVQAHQLAVQRQLQAALMLVSQLRLVQLAMKLKLKRPADRPM